MTVVYLLTSIETGRTISVHEGLDLMQKFDLTEDQLDKLAECGYMNIGKAELLAEDIFGNYCIVERQAFNKGV